MYSSKSFAKTLSASFIAALRFLRTTYIFLVVNTFSYLYPPAQIQTATGHLAGDIAGTAPVRRGHHGP